MKIKRRLKRKKDGHYCECGCGQEVKQGNRFIHGHQNVGRLGRKHTDEARLKMSLIATDRKHTKETKEKLSLINIGRTLSAETRKKISIANTGKIKSKEHRRKLSLANIGKKLSKEHKFKIGLSGLKYRNDGYCDAWADNEFKKDMRKDYCENVDCKYDSKTMNLHHIDLNNKDCRPINLMTLCASCHMFLHRKLKKINNNKLVGKDDFIILIEKTKVVYIHKINKKKVVINRM